MGLRGKRTYCPQASRPRRAEGSGSGDPAPRAFAHKGAGASNDREAGVINLRAARDAYLLREFIARGETSATFSQRRLSPPDVTRSITPAYRDAISDKCRYVAKIWAVGPFLPSWSAIIYCRSLYEKRAIDVWMLEFISKWIVN